MEILVSEVLLFVSSLEGCIVMLAPLSNMTVYLGFDNDFSSCPYRDRTGFRIVCSESRFLSVLFCDMKYLFDLYVTIFSVHFSFCFLLIWHHNVAPTMNVRSMSPLDHMIKLCDCLENIMH
ncbi:hypothetical protein KC19_8G197700 [Ceratodon purpureus]|uniref:Uncharacterized protein n=1 Tax=Ceratodon purpureus TaxID=3225 RepID=A0A8T0H2G8_CERPU|nr:hypothetical protein KC19_8G197700 [Ceratodon purpureus]